MLGDDGLAGPGRRRDEHVQSGIERVEGGPLEIVEEESVVEHRAHAAAPDLESESVSALRLRRRNSRPSRIESS